MDDLVRVEGYTPERRAEFLLSTAVDAEDYARAGEAVRQLGLDPATIVDEPAKSSAIRFPQRAAAMP